MKLGIIGLPQSGKTTIFNALTGGDEPTTTGGGRFQVNTAVVDVPDQRVDELVKMFNPKKTAYAKVTYEDIAGLDGSGSQSGISGQLLNALSQVDGFLLVVRAFENEQVAHPNNKINPANDIETMHAEFLLNDLIAVERKLERLADERKKGGGRDKAVIEKEAVVFEKLQENLNNDVPLRELEFNEAEQKIISGFGFLSQKKMLVVFNLSEGQSSPEATLRPGVIAISLMGSIEMEIAQLPPEDAEMFLEEYGIDEPSLSKMISHSYDLLGLQSFFTVGEDEVRAWTVAKGFIRAEVVAYDDLMELGSMAESRNNGKLRVEGKEYIVQDGEIVHIRFNV
jgi:GTP-binding protein YchF